MTTSAAGTVGTGRRRLGAPEAKNRTVLLDAAESLMRDEGYAAVTSRRVADKAGDVSDVGSVMHSSILVEAFSHNNVYRSSIAAMLTVHDATAQALRCRPAVRTACS